jgi:hypothetical protein
MGDIGINYKNGVGQGFHEHRRNWNKLQNGWVKVSMSIGGVQILYKLLVLVSNQAFEEEF